MIRTHILFTALLVFLFIPLSLSAINIGSGGYTVDQDETVSQVNISDEGVLHIKSGVHLQVNGDIVMESSGGHIQMEDQASLSANNIYMNTINTEEYGSGVTNEISTGTNCSINLSGDLDMNINCLATLGTDNTLDGGGNLRTNFSSIETASGTVVDFASKMNFEGESEIVFKGSEVNAGSDLISLGNLRLQNGTVADITGDVLLSSSTASALVEVTGSSWFEIEGNWHNRDPSGPGLFTSSSDVILRMNGVNQSIEEYETPFYNLIFQVDGIKTVNANVTVSNTLALGGSEAVINSVNLNVTNTDPGAITWNEGEGFISTTLQGSSESKLTRATASQQDYVFPLGNQSGTDRYRPVVLMPHSADQASYSASFYNVNVGNHFSLNYGSSLVSSDDGNPLNEAFFHRIRQESGSVPAAITIFYNPDDEGSYNTFAQPFSTDDGGGKVWEDIGDVNGISATRPGFNANNTTLSALRRGAYFNDLNMVDFALANGIADDVTPRPTYVVLHRSLDGGYYLTHNNKLHFEFDEEYKVASSTDLTYTVYNFERTSQGIPSKPVAHGDNRYTLDVSSLTEGNYYYLEITNSKDEKWYLRFKKND